MSTRVDVPTELTRDPDVSEALDRLTGALDESAPVVADMEAAVAGRDDDLARLTADVEAVVRHLDAPIIVVDDTLHVRLASPPTELLLEAGVAPGQPLGDVLPAPLVTAVTRCLAAEAPTDDAGPTVEAAHGRLRLTVERIARVAPLRGRARYEPDTRKRRTYAQRQAPVAFGLVRLSPA